MKRTRLLGRRWRIGLLLSLAVVVIAGGTIVGYRIATQVSSSIPPDMRDQLTFSPFIVPLGTRDITASEYKFSTVEDNVQILTYRIRLGDNWLTLSEYPQPSEFSDIPEYKDRFLSNVVAQTASVPTASGTIYLGRVSHQPDRQLAVMIERGLLVFLQPDNPLDEAAWRRLGDTLEVQRVTR